MDAAQPECDQRTEQRIVGEANHRFDAAGHHRLDERRHRRRRRQRNLRLPRSQSDPRRRSGRRPPSRVQPHRANVGLVRTRREASFAATGNPNQRQRRRLVGRVRVRAGSSGKPKASEHGRTSSPVSHVWPRASSAGPADGAGLVAGGSRSSRTAPAAAAPGRVCGGFRQRARRVFRKGVGGTRSRDRGGAAVATTWLGHDARQDGLVDAPARRPARCPSEWPRASLAAVRRSTGVKMTIRASASSAASSRFNRPAGTGAGPADATGQPGLPTLGLGRQERVRAAPCHRRRTRPATGPRLRTRRRQGSPAPQRS